jgi:hypothetical protein
VQHIFFSTGLLLQIGDRILASSLHINTLGICGLIWHMNAIFYISEFFDFSNQVEEKMQPPMKLCIRFVFDDSKTDLFYPFGRARRGLS